MVKGDVGRKELDRIDTLFVQNGAAFSAKDGNITLHGLADATVYFTNRPRREAGHMPSRRFLELWDGGKHGFAAEPPHAVLSFLDDEAGTPDDVVVRLHDPRLTGHEMTYRVEVLKGTLPESGGPCSLFIDAFGSPLTPASVAAARRPRRRRVSPTNT